MLRMRGVLQVDRRRSPFIRRVAAGGIDEFSAEFLPGLLAYQGNDAPRGLARLEAHDIGRE